MTQEGLIWAKLALLAEIRQNGGHSAMWTEITDSAWSDLKSAKIENGTPNAQECPCEAPEQATGCVPEIRESDR